MEYKGLTPLPKKGFGPGKAGAEEEIKSIKEED